MSSDELGETRCSKTRSAHCFLCRCEGGPQLADRVDPSGDLLEWVLTRHADRTVGLVRRSDSADRILTDDDGGRGHLKLANT